MTNRNDKKRCNRLDGKTWTRYSISIWSDIKKSAAEMRHNHPAAFPLELAGRCIEIFTGGPGEMVFDPFAGSGTTLIGAYNLGRQSAGMEIYDHFRALFEQRLADEGLDCAAGGCPPPILYMDDARNTGRYFSPASVDFVLTSPPYWDILLSRRSADRREQRDYGDNPADLGRGGNYGAYLEQMESIFGQVHAILKPGRYCVVVVMDLRKKSAFYPLHIDLSLKLQQVGFELDDLIIWDRRREYNRLRPLGFPSVFRINKTHEYLLIFRKKTDE